MEEKRKLYLELVFGSIGMLIVFLFIANALFSDYRPFSISILILGITFMNGYIFFLEKKLA
ncbi:hypothetical protein AB3U99_05550 [Niallia sp. JL1B1071]|uniref:hypothetical protein n=1 Tax=Niallia tiangongensis TaxID=3237105 RepID=UPI0037DCDBC3